MPLEPCVRKDSKYFYAKGKVEYNGRPITGSYYKSTGSLTEAGARDWIARETEVQIRRHLFGEEKMFTFADAVLAYAHSETDEEEIRRRFRTNLEQKRKSKASKKLKKRGKDDDE